MPDECAAGGEPEAQNSGSGTPKKRVAAKRKQLPVSSSSPDDLEALVPSGKPPGRGRITPTSPQRYDRIWRALDAHIGGREGLLAAALASPNPKAKDLVNLLLDSGHREVGTKILAFRAGLSVREVVEMFKEMKGVEMDLALYEALPDIIRDAADDAKASMVPCDACKGRGGDWDKGEGGETCYVCKGKGTVRRPGDPGKLKFVGEVAGLTGKQGPLIQNNQQINVTQTAPVSNFEDLMRKAALRPGEVSVIDVKAEDEHKTDET